MAQHNPPLHVAVERLRAVRGKVGHAYEFDRPLELDLLQTWHDLEVVLAAAAVKAEESMVPAFRVEVDGVAQQDFPFVDDPVSTTRATAMIAAQTCARRCRAHSTGRNVEIRLVRVPEAQ